MAASLHYVAPPRLHPSTSPSTSSITTTTYFTNALVTTAVASPAVRQHEDAYYPRLALRRQMCLQ